jgi:hypothetical protein
MGKSDRCALQKVRNTNIVVLSKDISERKHVEALRESAEHKRTEEILHQQAEQEQMVATMQARITDLERQVQERTAQLQQALNFEAMLKRITDKVGTVSTKARFLATAVQELAQGLRVKRCDTTLYNADQTTATICYEYTTSSPPSFQGCVVQMADFPSVFEQLRQGQCFQFVNRFQPYLVSGYNTALSHF